MHPPGAGKKLRLVSHVPKSMGMGGVDSWGAFVSVYQTMGVIASPDVQTGAPRPRGVQ